MAIVNRDYVLRTFGTLCLAALAIQITVPSTLALMFVALAFVWPITHLACRLPDGGMGRIVLQSSIGSALGAGFAFTLGSSIRYVLSIATRRAAEAAPTAQEGGMQLELIECCSWECWSLSDHFVILLSIMVAAAVLAAVLAMPVGLVARQLGGRLASAA